MPTIGRRRRAAPPASSSRRPPIPPRGQRPRTRPVIGRAAARHQMVAPPRWPRAPTGANPRARRRRRQRAAAVEARRYGGCSSLWR
eukprot:6288434-Prymnesium_polylepis.2